MHEFKVGDTVEVLKFLGSTTSISFDVGDYGIVESLDKGDSEFEVKIKNKRGEWESYDWFYFGELRNVSAEERERTEVKVMHEGLTEEVAELERKRMEEEEDEEVAKTLEGIIRYRAIKRDLKQLIEERDMNVGERQLSKLTDIIVDGLHAEFDNIAEHLLEEVIVDESMEEISFAEAVWYFNESHDVWKTKEGYEDELVRNEYDLARHLLVGGGFSVKEIAEERD